MGVRRIPFRHVGRVTMRAITHPDAPEIKARPYGPVFGAWDQPGTSGETSVTPALLEGLAPTHVVASLSIPSWNQIARFLESMRQLRESSGFAA